MVRCFHAAPGSHVANIHKTLLRRAFFCFHRLITAGTSNDRRLIHSILHNPSPHPQFLSAPLSWRMLAEPSPSVSSDLRECFSISSDLLELRGTVLLLQHSQDF